MDEEPFKILLREPVRGMELIMAKHGALLKNWLRKFLKNDDELIQDVISETFMEVWIARDEILKKDNPSIWMMVIAKNIALKKLKYNKKRKKASIKEIKNMPSSDMPHKDLHYREIKDIILLKAQELTPREREILIASKIDEMDNKELEETFGLQPQRVRNLLSSAVAKMRKMLKEMR
ncbi:sigma-70 family RNA polymerase sigma factor [Sphingobacterium faecale]|uniref:Sigma-70 family RNA polymerase sigma factor n=1 Tax=Sphingobacterium faecale TaxID=2803775 RepID=A0ABS1R2R2_9SPHI|nr:sigma-70 family RNA polymerase sigma factor [Sphingobacterium faecale]MBL1408996.1 sigma-70 family RNA polymerase sigma factor [Sphingobacterium faecale]